jgi:hypothetical protein
MQMGDNATLVAPAMERDRFIGPQMTPSQALLIPDGQVALRRVVR